MDFHLGPTLGYAMWGDFKPEGGGPSTSLKSNRVYGANFGLDVPFKGNWAFNAGLRYLWAKAEPDVSGGESIDVNPWVLTAGVSYKF